MRSSTVRPGPVQWTIAVPIAATTVAQMAQNVSGSPWSQAETARNRPAAGPQRSGGTTLSSTGTKYPARRPQHDGETGGQGQRHSERLADRRDLPVAQVGDPRRGGEQERSLDTPVGLEDHRLGGRRGGGHRLGETVLDQRPAPAFQQADAKGRPLAALRPHRDIECAFEFEAGFQQIGNGTEAIHTSLAPKHQRGEYPPPEDAQAERAHHRTASASTVRLAAASCSVPAPLSRASNGSTAPPATSFHILPPIGAPSISWRQ